jgi:GNAT superfamily N-acetyltransferase
MCIKSDIMVKVQQIDPDDRKLVRQFLGLPSRLYANTPQWVPPLAIDASRYVDRKHRFYQHSEAAFFVAYEERRVVGRLVVLDNRRYNEFNHEQTAFFNQFECEDDPPAARALFESAFDWAKERGLTRISGPKGFTALDGMGLLVKGFEHRAAFGIAYNMPYYGCLIECAGFIKQGELVSGYMNPATPFPSRIDELAEIVKHRRGLSIMRFSNRRDLHRAIPALRELYNNSLNGTTGTTPLSEDEVNAMASQLEWFADPRLIKIVMKDDQPVGFVLAYPDISAALQRTHGKLLPFGWADMLLELKRTPWVNINGAGIADKYRGLGGTALLFSEMRKSVIEGGYQHADIVQIGIENEKMQREMRDLGINFYKTHRIYERMLGK